ncbi:MAG: hypothetical protein EBZ36_10280 [Acidobacteria bacterium]|jgi:hypothetical protein|nr:hypothetical protein [Acidobacteriota bacterium]
MNMTNNSKIPGGSRTIIAILLGGLIFRAANLDALAPIVDETGHLWESVYYSMNSPFDRLLSGKYLGYLFYKPIYLLAWNPLYGARLFTVFVSLITAFYIYRIAERLVSPYAGIAAMFCYLVSPFAYFHDRQAIFDPLVSTFFAASLYYFLCGLQRHVNLVLAGLLFMLGMTVKIYLLCGLVFLPVLYFSAKYLHQPDFRPDPLPGIRKLLALFASGSILSLLSLVIIAPTPGYSLVNVRKATGQLSHFLLRTNMGTSRELSDLPRALRWGGNYLIEGYFQYVGKLAALLIVSGAIYVVIQRRYDLLLLLVVTFASFYPYGVLSYMFPRYTHFLQVPISIFCGSILALAAERLWKRIDKPLSLRGFVRAIPGIESLMLLVFLLFAAHQVYVSTRIMYTPLFRMAKDDRITYERGWANAIGIDEVASALKDISLRSDKRLHVVTIGWGMHSVWTLPLKFRGTSYPITFYHDWIMSEWQRENLREILKTTRVLFFIEHPVAFIDQKEMLKIGSSTKVLFTYQKGEPDSYYEIVELLE